MTSRRLGSLRSLGAGRVALAVLAIVGCTALIAAPPEPTQFRDAAGQLRVALVKQPFVPNGTSAGPTTMAEGGIQPALKASGATVRVSEIELTPEQEPEYGGWKRLGFALGHLGRPVAANVRDGYFNVGLLGTCPSMPGMVAGLQHSGTASKPRRDGHALARRASRLQHAGDDTQRIAWRDAGGGGHRPLPARHAPRRRTRSSARRRSRRHGRRQADRSARAGAAGQIAHQTVDGRRSADDRRRRSLARWID